MDDDLKQMSREQLIAEVKKLRQGIRKHRDSTDHEICAGTIRRYGRSCRRSRTPLPSVPDWPQFMRVVHQVSPITR